MDDAINFPDDVLGDMGGGPIEVEVLPANRCVRVLDDVGWMIESRTRRCRPASQPTNRQRQRVSPNSRKLELCVWVTLPARCFITLSL